MSGIAGIIHFDGKPFEPGLIEKMTSAMAHRGPDGINHWVKGSVALGQCMLRVSDELEDENQPCTLDGQIWITADARIDSRDELIGTLRASGHHVRRDAADVELILHAYGVFGEAFLERVIGDFAFALWDSRSAKLICARDHFGVRPFFYAKTDHVFLFASDIDALLKYPTISADLDEEAIGDFLLFCNYQNPELSIYRNIRRLPAAHCIRLTPDRFCLQQYWTLPLHNEIRYRKDSEYIDQFQEVFSEAVNDRLRTNQVAVELSGGMDCTSIAAIAKTTGHSVTAHTITCNGLLPDDQEGHYASMVASYLDIPIFFRAIENYALFDRYDNPQLKTSEPFPNPDLSVHYDHLRQVMKNGARVLLSGQGGDALYSKSSTYYARLLRNGHIIRLLTELYRYVRRTGSLSGSGLRSATLGRLVKQVPWQPAFPDWIDKEFARRAYLKDRWELGWKTIHNSNDIYYQLCAPWVSNTFENYEALKIPLIAQHPFFDVRLAVFMMSLPDYIKTNKYIMRESMRGKLPDLVRTRPKTGLAGDHFRERFSESWVQISVELKLTKARNGYVDTGRYSKAFKSYLNGYGTESTWFSYYMITPIALNNWLLQHSI